MNIPKIFEKAIEDDDSDIVIDLLSKNLITPNYINRDTPERDDNCPMDYACYLGSYNVIKVLLEHKDLHFSTYFFTIVCRSQRFNCLDLFIEDGRIISNFKFLINPLKNMIRMKIDSVIQYLFNIEGFSDYLLNNHLELYQQSKSFLIKKHINNF